MTIYEAVFYLKNSLKTIYDNGEASGISNWVLEHITGKDKLHLILNKTSPLLPEQIDLLMACEKDLLQYKPVQYLLKEAYFYEMKLQVNESVLIPRPETEELVAWIIQHYRENTFHAPSVLDIGTGSGCIALALKRQLPDAIVSAMDISPEALNVAQANATEHQLDIDFFSGNILEASCVETLPQYDTIVSNPPYIHGDEAGNMDRNVLRYEPHTALFVTDRDPLQFYKAIEQAAATILKPAGSMFFEVNQQYAAATEQYFKDKGWHTVLRNDLNHNPRILLARR